jgi:catechol 2,3-dioxygenase-like lactoylglutathione lyase family enzyme
METRGLLELVLEVADLERAVRFYGDVLGLAEVTRWGAERPAVWLRLGPNEVLGLWPRSSGGPGVAIHASRGGKHVHFAVYVAPGSLESWLDRVSSAGLDVEGPVHFSQGRSIFVTDPDGNVVELADWEKDWEGKPAAKSADKPAG